MIWSKYAIDYSKGLDIIDYETNIIYTDDEAKKLDKEIQHRLILQPRKIGAWVYTLEECKQIMKEKENDKRNNGN